MPRAGIDYSVLALPKPGKKRGEPIRTDGTLKTYVRLAKVNKERQAEAQERDFGPQAEACRMLPCAVCGWRPRPGQETDPHHEPPRSLGGTDEDCVPLGPSFLDKGYGCGCHQLRHSMTDVEFWGAAGKDPLQVKAQVRAFMETDAFLLRGEA